MYLKFEFIAPEPWYLDAFEVAVHNGLKNDEHVLHRKAQKTDPKTGEVLQDYAFFAPDHTTFFSLGMIVSLMYSCIEQGTVSENFKHL